MPSREQLQSLYLVLTCNTELEYPPQAAISKKGKASSSVNHSSVTAEEVAYP